MKIFVLGLVLVAAAFTAAAAVAETRVEINPGQSVRISAGDQVQVSCSGQGGGGGGGGINYCRCRDSHDGSSNPIALEQYRSTNNYVRLSWHTSMDECTVVRSQTVECQLGPAN